MTRAREFEDSEDAMRAARDLREIYHRTPVNPTPVREGEGDVTMVRVGDNDNYLLEDGSVGRPGAAPERISTKALTPMKALTMSQPWASLVELEIQRIETRSWRPNARVLGQRIAIHAAKKVVSDPRETGLETWQAIVDLYGAGWVKTVPTGVVLATALLRTVLQVDSIDPGRGLATVLVEGRRGETKTIPIEPHGNFNPGRWLWVLEDVRRLDPPQPARGALGLWDWTTNAETREQ